MITLDQAYDEFLFHCRYEKNLTDKTLKAYTIDLRQFQEYLDTLEIIPSVTGIDKHVLRGWLKPLMEWAKPKTVKRKVATLKAFFTYLEFEDYITVNPFRKMRIRITQDNYLPVVMTLGEVRLLFDYLYLEKAALSTLTRRGQRNLIRDIAVLEMLFATGMRVSELCNLKQQDLDLQDASVRIFGKGRRQRLAPLCHPPVLDIMRRYQDMFHHELSSTDFLFLTQQGSPLTPQSVRILIEKHTQTAGIAKKVTPHTFRHTVATLLLENGLDLRNIQHLLGHSTISTTQIYAKVNTHSQRALLKQKHPRQHV